MARSGAAAGAMRPRVRRVALQSLVGWATLTVVLASALALGANRPVSWTFLALAVFVFFLVQVTLDLSNGVGAAGARIVAPAMLFVASLVWGFLQTVPGLLPALAGPSWNLVPDAAPRISATPNAGYHILMRLSSYAMVFWIMLRSAESAGRASRFLIAVALFSAALASYGLVAQLVGRNPILGSDASGAVSASFVNRNSYATYAGLGAVANIAVYLNRTSFADWGSASASLRWRRLIETFFQGAWVFALGGFLCLAAVFLTRSRAGSAAVVLGIATLLLCYGARQRGWRSVLTLSLLLPVGVAATTLLGDVMARINATDAGELRFLIYPRIVEGFAARPWTGHGLGAFEDTFRRWVPLEAGFAEWNYAHNSYLENFYELGVPAALAFYAALGWIVVVLVGAVLRRRRNRMFASVAVASCALAGFHSLFDFSLQMPATASLLAVVLGFGWAHAFRTRRRRDEAFAGEHARLPDGERDAPRPVPEKSPEIRRFSAFRRGLGRSCPALLCRHAASAKDRAPPPE